MPQKSGAPGRILAIAVARETGDFLAMGVVRNPESNWLKWPGEGENFFAEVLAQGQSRGPGGKLFQAFVGPGSGNPPSWLQALGRMGKYKIWKSGVFSWYEWVSRLWIGNKNNFLCFYFPGGGLQVNSPVIG